MSKPTDGTEIDDDSGAIGPKSRSRVSVDIEREDLARTYEHAPQIISEVLAQSRRRSGGLGEFEECLRGMTIDPNGGSLTPAAITYILTTHNKAVADAVVRELAQYDKDSRLLKTITGGDGSKITTGRTIAVRIEELTKEGRTDSE